MSTRTDVSEPAAGAAFLAADAAPEEVLTREDLSGRGVRGEEGGAGRRPGHVRLC